MSKGGYEKGKPFVSLNSQKSKQLRLHPFSVEVFAPPSRGNTGSARVCLNLPGIGSGEDRGMGKFCRSEPANSAGSAQVLKAYGVLRAYGG